MIQHGETHPASPARVVILGASGFVGRALSIRLEQLAIETLPLTSAQIDLTEADAVGALRQNLQPADVLVFCSALTPDKGRDTAALMKNLRMGQHVAAVIEQSPCQQVLYVSSDAVYEESPNPVRDDTAPAPASLYGLMHLTREKMLAAAVAKSNTALAILRPCAIYGPGDTHNSYGPNRFLRTARQEGRVALFGKGEERRHHLYIRDLIAVMVECLRRRSHGVGTIVGAESISFGDLAKKIRALVQPPPRIEFVSRPGGVITHRHYDLAPYLKSFVHLPLTPLEQGLRESWEAPGL